MFRAMLFSFLAGVMVSQPLLDWAADNAANTSQQVQAMLHIDAYDRITAALH
ncbi:MAG: hypothetical protein ABI608_10940 [Rhizomicrobium sp.]